MERVLKRLHWKICLFYLVDVIVMGRTFEKELERLKEVFKRLARAGLKLKPNKCFLFPKWISRLGNVIIEEGIAADPEKVEQVFMHLAQPGKQHGSRSKVFLDLPLSPPIRP